MPAPFAGMTCRTSCRTWCRMVGRVSVLVMRPVSVLYSINSIFLFFTWLLAWVSDRFKASVRSVTIRSRLSLCSTSRERLSWRFCTSVLALRNSSSSSSLCPFMLCGNGDLSLSPRVVRKSVSRSRRFVMIS